MRRLPNIYLNKKRKVYTNKVYRKSCHKYNDTPFIYFNNNIVEIIEVKERRKEDGQKTNHK